MGFCLPPNIHFCFLGEAVLILDEAKDRYFQLTGEPAAALRILADGDVPPPAGINRLSELVIIKDDGRGGKPIRPTQGIAPTQSAIESDDAKSRRNLLITVEVARRLAGAFLLLRRRGFAEALIAAKTLNGGAFEQSKHALMDAVHEFDCARRQIPVRPSCLRDSIALTRFLEAREYSTDLVIGVKLNPFSAHCWVQWEDIALNEAVDRAAAYSPIRIV
jgi:hypothetical protein